MACMAAAVGAAVSAAVLARRLQKRLLLCGLGCGAFYAVCQLAATLLANGRLDWQGSNAMLPLALLLGGQMCIRDSIYPGIELKAIDGLITNFHLPESTLIMLIAAFYGYDKTMAAYKVAVEEKYRFFSFGDAMFIR